METNIMNKSMELQKAVDILMHLHRHKLGKADKPTCTEAEINTARNVLMRYNNLQRTIVAGRTTGVSKL
jgi:hypothetical protein